VIVRIITYERSTLVNDEKYIGLDVHQATISMYRKYKNSFFALVGTLPPKGTKGVREFEE
jgi:hypothetical protein